MSFNIFDSATKDNIRVGYIDPERGYIATNSIYEANLYASKRQEIELDTYQLMKLIGWVHRTSHQIKSPVRTESRDSDQMKLLHILQEINH